MDHFQGVTPVARNDTFWAYLGAPAARQPVSGLTRDAAVAVRNAVTCAPITGTIRGINQKSKLVPTKDFQKPV
jgi:mRNA interferase MazF